MNYFVKMLKKFVLVICVILFEKSLRIWGLIPMELCAGQFDIHRNMIIRTEESLAIGGKYLQGIELYNVDECRRLCCETDACDVFIFEEKAEGYCYLFECGSPENFHCKFTKHVNFTSAVMTPMRHTLTETTTKYVQQQQQQPAQIAHNQSLNLSQQEKELRKLKQKLGDSSKDKTSTTTMAPPITTHKITISNCGRFQFQCHSGECIGIYNACNGIPQCEDGSDEGPECSVGNTINSPPSKVSQLIKNNLNTNNNLGYESHLFNNDRAVIKSNVLQAMPGQYQAQHIAQSPVINNREDPMSAPQIWPNQKLSEPQVIPEPNIFSHSGGIQIPANNMQQYQNTKSNIIYNQMPSNTGIYLQPTGLQQNPYRQVIQPQQNMMSPVMNWQNQQRQQQLQPEEPNIIAGNYYGANNQLVNQQHQPQITSVQTNQQPIDATNDVHHGNADEKTVAENSSTIGPNVPKNNHPDKVKQDDKVEDSDEYTDYNETSTEAPKKKQRKHKKLPKKNKKDPKKNKVINESGNPPYHSQYKLVKENLEMEFVDHDGYSERPGGAVLSLTLGILVAAALAILIGCRMRTVSRRVRRLGKNSLGEDADFLVNGMYL